MQHLQSGTLLKRGDYKILQLLGQGGFGVTYLAIQSGLERKVAVKEFFMKDFCSRDESTSHVSVGTEGSRETVERFREKFLKEARNLAKLKHPNIVSVIDVFEENGTAYYVMEFAECGSLADKVKREGYLTEPVATRYILQVADALRYVHQRKMNHLDVKPANIMLNENDETVLIDFGLAKQYDSTGSQTSSTPVGISEGYAPMEQYKQGGVGAFSPETDIYALGATFFKLLTGQTPPSASDIFEDGVPVDVLQAKGVSHAAISAICKAMEGKKKNRMSSVQAFVDSLNRVDDSTTIQTLPSGVGERTIVSSASDETIYPSAYGKTTSNKSNTSSSTARPHFQPDSKAAKLWPLAERGDVDAQNQLGDCYFYGEGVTRDYQEAIKWFNRAAEQGHAEAQCNLGFCYENGHGQSIKYPDAIKWYRKAAEQGYARAQYCLGGCYEKGRGVTRNFTEAVKWYLKAAEQGDVDAQCNLGLCYEKGNGVTQNYTEAVEWYLKAAEQGNAIAAYNLGICYEYGKGVAKDLETAIEYYYQANELGHETAKNKYLVLRIKNYVLKIKNWIFENKKFLISSVVLAVLVYALCTILPYLFSAERNYLEKAENGDIEAQLRLAKCYEKGERGVDQSDSKAVNWYRQAAEQGNAEAQVNLGACYEKGKGVPRSSSEAILWYQKAAEQGYADAQYILAGCYYFGKFTTKDYTEAVKWYRKASEQGHAQAQCCLGYCYEYGHGVPLDMDEALSLYHKSAEQGDANAKYNLKRLTGNE